MMIENLPKLSLARPATYQIKVLGHLNQSLEDRHSEMALTVHCLGDGLLVSTLTGTIDQAALHGLLRRFYSLGLPLISIVCLEVT